MFFWYSVFIMIKQMQKKIIAITGPSASGKTNLAVRLAKNLNGEVISVDSRQIYKELNIGSAKPTIEERQGIEHHQIDIKSITQEYTAANYSDDAKVIINNILNKGKIPILAGGTGLYYRILLQDFDLPRVAPNQELRLELDRQTSDELYKQLQKLDKELSEKIHPNNKVKIIRALEVCITLGMPMSKAQKKKESEYNTIWFGLNSSDRDFLYDRINKRTDIMMEQGLLKEAESLFNKYSNNKILTGTIGYQEFLPFIKGETDIETAINLLKQNTRRYAKRQISWFNANKDINWFDIKTQTIDEIEENAIKIYNYNC